MTQTRATHIQLALPLDAGLYENTPDLAFLQSDMHRILDAVLWVRVHAPKGRCELRVFFRDGRMTGKINKMLEGD